MSFSCGSRRILSQLPVRFPMLSEAASYLKTVMKMVSIFSLNKKAQFPKCQTTSFRSFGKQEV